MNLRKIEADSYKEALAKVRSAYGEDALIVGTRTLQRGGVLGLGGRQVVEVYVTDTKKRLARLKEARKTGPGQGSPRPGGPERTDSHPAPESGSSSGLRAQNGPPLPQGPGSGTSSSLPGVYTPPNSPKPSPAPAQIQSQPSFRDTAGSVSSTGSYSSGAVTRREVEEKLGAIGETLSELRGEVQHLLRRSEGPPWGHKTLEKAFSLLRERDVQEDIARKIVSGLDREVIPENDMDGTALRGIVAAHIARFLKEAGGEKKEPSGPVQIFVGPTGVGKTTTIAKLAARERYTYGRRVALLTLDTYRIAAVDQLRRYADIIGLELKVVTDPPSLKEAVNSMEGYDRIFVDSAGRSPADEMRLGELESFVKEAEGANVNLVLSVTAGHKTLQRSIERFRRIGFQGLVLTKLDEVESRGGILSAVAEGGSPVNYVTNGQNVPDDIEVADPQYLADLIFHGG